MKALRSLTVTFAGDATTLRVRYDAREDGPNPGTKARSREVRELARQGLTEALRALSGRVDVVGESGFESREDVLCASSRSEDDGV